MLTSEPDASVHPPPVGRTVTGQLTRLALVSAVLPLLVGAGVVALALRSSVDQADTRAARAVEVAQTELAGPAAARDAAAAAQLIDRFMVERLDDAVALSRNPVVVGAVTAPREELDAIADWSPSLIEARLDAKADQLDSTGVTEEALEAAVGDHPSYRSALVTDANGYVVGATAGGDFAHRHQPWWQAAWRSGAHLGPIEADSSGTLTLTLAVRVDHPDTGRAVGVVLATIDAGAVVRASDLSSGEGDRASQVWVLHPNGTQLAGAEPPPDSAPVVADALAAVAGGSRSGSAVGDDAVTGYATTANRYPIDRLGMDIAGPSLVAVVSRPATPTTSALGGVIDGIGADLRSRALALALILGGLLLAAGAGAYLAARTTSRRIVEPMYVLRNEAHRLADSELPELVTLLRSTDGSGELPVVDLIELDAEGEVAELADAFNRLRATTVELAAGQALDHSKELASVLINLGRRNQQLIGRQLRFIDELELTESDPDVLRNLFTLDQMATRMRRNADNLLVLAGEQTMRHSGRPLPVEEVLRAATSEVEHFARVKLTTVDQALVQPAAVNDLTHLLAELIENATLFSPADTPVEVAGRWDGDLTYTISVSDRGPGLSRPDLAAANARITQPVMPADQPINRLGLYVVGRLAHHHQIDARLVESATTGTTAKVTLRLSTVTPVPQPSGEVIGSRLRTTAEVRERRAGAFPPPVRPSTSGQLPVIEPEVDLEPARAEPAAQPEPAADQDPGEELPIPPFRARRSKLGASAETGAETEAEEPALPHPPEPPRRQPAGQGSEPETGSVPLVTIEPVAIEWPRQVMIDPTPMLVPGPVAALGPGRPAGTARRAQPGDETGGEPIPLPPVPPQTNGVPGQATNGSHHPVGTSDEEVDHGPMAPPVLALVSSNGNHEHEDRAVAIRDRLTRFSEAVAAAKAVHNHPSGHQPGTSVPVGSPLGLSPSGSEVDEEDG